MRSSNTGQMAERILLFAPADAIDYKLLTTATFDWTEWKEEEAKRR